MAKSKWSIFASATYRLEQQYVPQIMAVIKAFRKHFIADLQTHGKDAAVNNLHKRTYANDLPGIVDLMYKKGGIVGARLQAAELKPYEAEARRMLAKGREVKAIGGFGRNEQWIRELLKFLKIHMLDILQDMTQTMRDDILNILQKGVDENLTIPQMVKNLQAEGLIQSRAKLIARTEINKAANAGHKVVAMSTPYEVEKGWSAAQDHRTRHSHQLVNGQWTDEDGLFNVAIYKGEKLIGHEQMDGPGDPKATVGNLANCRCRRLYRPKRDSKGNLIMRQTNVAPVIPMRLQPQYTTEQIAAQLKSNIFVGVENK